MFPRRFALVRHVDYTGVSGIGVVAYGVVFFDGQVALRWCSTHPATSLWDSLEDMLAIHGHGEATSVQWIDQSTDAIDETALSAESPRGRRARRPDSAAPAAPATPAAPADATASAEPTPAPPVAPAESNTVRPVPPANGPPANASPANASPPTPATSATAAGTPTAPLPTPSSLVAPAGLVSTPWTNGRLMTALQPPSRPDTDPRDAIAPDLPPPPPPAPAAAEPPATSPNAGVPAQRRAGRHRRPPPPEQPPHDPTSDGGHR